MRYLEVKFSDELPPEKEVVFCVDQKGKQIVSSRYGDLMDMRSSLHPVEWFDYWLKKEEK